MRVKHKTLTRTAVTTPEETTLEVTTQEGDTALGFPAEVCSPDAKIARVYQFFCIDVDESYLVAAMTDQLPTSVELLWPEGGGRAHGYVFGFNEKKKFTGEYVHLASEKVF